MYMLYDAKIFTKVTIALQYKMLYYLNFGNHNLDLGMMSQPNYMWQQVFLTDVLSKQANYFKQH